MKKILALLLICSFETFSQIEVIETTPCNQYSVILKGFDNPSKDIILNLPNDVLVLRYTKNMGIVSFQFVHSVDKSELFGRSTYMTRKQVDKLFAKIME